MGSLKTVKDNKVLINYRDDKKRTSQDFIN